MIENRSLDPKHQRLYEAAFEKRPAEELYDLARDPDQLTSVAADPAYATVRQELSARPNAALTATGDPRLLGGAERFDEYLYLGIGPKHPAWEAASRP
jgi:hypothetical protein